MHDLTTKNNSDGSTASEAGLSTSSESEDNADEVKNFLLILYVSNEDLKNQAIFSMNVPEVSLDSLHLDQINEWLNNEDITKEIHLLYGHANVEYTEKTIFYYKEYQRGSPKYKWKFMKTINKTVTIVDWKPLNKFCIEYNTYKLIPRTDLISSLGTVTIPIPSTKYWNPKNWKHRMMWLYLAWEYGKATYLKWPQLSISPYFFTTTAINNRSDVFAALEQPFGHFTLKHECISTIATRFHHPDTRIVSDDVRHLQDHSYNRCTRKHFTGNIDTIAREAKLFSALDHGHRTGIAKEWFQILVDNNRLYNSPLLPVYFCNILAVCSASITIEDIPLPLQKRFASQLDIFFPQKH